jgi:2-polyprenyl-6-methoxyphenol hydroxylase-like FAD-dependent oxidoreductase
MYDAIIVGARCAGSPTAMLLSRRGHRVLLVDRAAFPSDTLSTHYIHQPGVACLERWGLLDQVVAAGTPPIPRLTFDVGPFALVGTPPPAGTSTHAYAPRRSILDRILAEAAVAAGAELRDHFAVQGLVSEGDRVVGIRGRAAGGRTVTEKASLVVGADGMRSLVARSVDAPTYDARPSLTCAFYSYWDDVAVDATELYARPERMIIAAPTNDGATLVIAYWPNAAFDQVRTDVEGSFLAALDHAPGLAERVRGGRRVEPFRGTDALPFFFRRPYGPGWALVGDAGYHKDPITAEGITDAFRDAELLADALDAGFTGAQPAEEALAGYERRRNEAALPVYEFTQQLAALAPPPPELQALFAALRDDQEQTDRFFGTIAGTVSLPEFFGRENLARIVGHAEAA